MLDCGFAKISTWAYPCFSKLSVSFKLGAGGGGVGREGLCLAGCQLVAQT